MLIIQHLSKILNMCHHLKKPIYVTQMWDVAQTRYSFLKESKQAFCFISLIKFIIEIPVVQDLACQQQHQDAFVLWHRQVLDSKNTGYITQNTYMLQQLCK